MAEMTIRLEIDRLSGRKNVVISYRSDEDALPVEHEEDHRRLVDQLIEGGLLKASEVGRIVVQRESAEGNTVELPEGQPEQQQDGIKQES